MQDQTLEQTEKTFQDYVLQTYERIPLSFKRGVGAKLYDDKDVDYLDFCSGIGVISLGHSHPKFVKDLQDQVAKILHVSNYYYIESQGLAAKKILELAGIKNGKVSFYNSGAEANECGFKIVRKWGNKRGKYKILTLEQSFHGRTYGAITATAQPSLQKGFYPLVPGFEYAKDLDDMIRKVKRDPEVACVLIELIQGEGGVNALDKAKVKELEKTCKEHEVLFMVDEVQSGIYRSGEFLATQIYDVKPDIISLAKGLAGGLVIGASVTTIKDALTPGEHGTTFGGNALSTTACLSALGILEEYYNSGAVAKTVKKMDEFMDEILKEFPNIFVSKEGLGLMRGLRAKDLDTQKKVIKLAQSERLLLLKSGRNVVRLLPPVIISDAELEEGFKRMKNALKKM
ncbi:hypothetical protein BKH43_02730 [Helicobacter sp. 13S00401-1]|uniref:aminotransferase class III-fold pyridoxal phosphate-dependent enzyme n=1 Tax=Helicobacter sp. 13S00401-1 TaxID=1905758 RepID=UPI000BA7B2B0|nr:aminotransferase class III-fold pyridoxal phosphate-dependent enzyme [Helicobacter sp. 13S00401-1]PAF51138.1 hypothetical protein BKH43_02730 [Helicobacter sp. 13S00401-1]